MSVSRAVLIDMALARTDEITPTTAALMLDTANNLTKPVKEYIDEVLDEAANDILMVAPPHKLMRTTYFVSDSTSTATINVNVLRLLSATISTRTSATTNDWYDRNINAKDFAQVGSPIHLQQQHKHTAATDDKPVVVYDSNRKVFYFYPLSRVSIHYIAPVPIGFANTSAFLTDDSIVPAIAWRAAGKVFDIMGQGDRAKLCFEQVEFIVSEKQQ